MTAATALRVSATCQLLLALYFEAIQWFRFGAWNNQPKFEPLWNQARAGSLSAADFLIVLAFLLPCALFILAWRRGWSWLMWCCVAGYGGWLFLQIRTWWFSYLFGASDNWKAVYQRTFSQTTKILPSFGDHLAPDGMHFVLQLLLLAVVIFAVRGLLHLGAADGTPRVRL
jgi:hypothetical protein